MAKRNRNKEVPSVRSKDTQYQVDVVKRLNLGQIPLFVQLGHRGLEKSVPAGVKSENGVTFVVPVDILKLSVSDPAILESVESIEFVYGIHEQGVTALLTV